MKTIESKIAPNPKEAQIWVDLSTDPHGLVKKYWNGKKWIVKENNIINTDNVINELKPTFNAINDELKNIKSSVEFLLTCPDEYVLKLIEELTNRVSKLEMIVITKLNHEQL